MESVTVANLIVDNIGEAVEYFADIATGDGLAPLLVLSGGLLIVFASVVFGVLTLGAIGSLVTSS